MTAIRPRGVSRRAVLVGAAGAAAFTAMPGTGVLAAGQGLTLRAAPGRVRLVPEPHGLTDVWAYGADGKEGGSGTDADIGNWAPQ